MPKGRRAVPWGAWFAVVFALFNSCAGHHEAWATGVWLSEGHWSPGPTMAVRAIRAACNDDGDINRYLAYANAALGRPYQAFYIQPLESWKTEPVDEVGDYHDPSVVAPVRPVRALVPYKDFSVEYPPGLFPFAILPALLSANMDVYRVAFSTLMGLLLTLGLWLTWKTTAKIAPDRMDALLTCSAWVALAAGVIIVRRFDAIVAASLCAVVWGCLVRKPTVVGVSLGVGVAAKLVPALVAPLALAYWLTRKRWKEAAIASAVALGTLAAVLAPFVFSAGPRILDLVTYHKERQLEIESTGGALLIVSRLFVPSTVTLSRAFASSAAVATWDAPVRTGSALLLIAAMGYVLFWATKRLRRESDDRAAALLLARASCAMMVAWMALGKVFSPQYITWLIPLGALVSTVNGTRSLRLFFAALVLTQAIYPFAFKTAGFAESLNPAFGALVLVRNALLLLWGLSLLRIHTGGSQHLRA